MNPSHPQCYQCSGVLLSLVQNKSISTGPPELIRHLFGGYLRKARFTYAHRFFAAGQCGGARAAVFAEDLAAGSAVVFADGERELPVAALTERHLRVVGPLAVLGARRLHLTTDGQGLAKSWSTIN